MTVEELKIEAKKLGYKLVKDAKKESFLPCVCGANKREHFYNSKKNLDGLRCSKCGLTVYGYNDADTKKNWNEMIRRMTENG